MVKNKIEWSIRSKRHVLKIQKYLEEINSSAAVKVTGEIKATAELLLVQPLLGKPWVRNGTRKLVLKKYTYSIIYRVAGSKVVVLAVAHQSLKNQA
ncbi:MAG: type II toxin-antitoxin system RelE/ParE family toxin [Sideroxydans sp.]|nr:type II toxin-antitoxin system RelE/ParE family toxin [Sideroxydans sp.]